MLVHVAVVLTLLPLFIARGISYERALAPDCPKIKTDTLTNSKALHSPAPGDHLSLPHILATLNFIDD